MTGGAESRLSRADLRSIIGFLDDLRDLDVDEPYPVEVLARLTGLIRGDAVIYMELDLATRQALGGSDYAPGVADYEDDEARYWAVGPCPITEYRHRTRDTTALRMTDIIGWRRYREHPIYREYFHPLGLDRLLEIGLSTEPRRHRSLDVFRGGDVAEFSERDRIVLEALRPHFQAREARAALRRRLLDDGEALEESQAAEAGLTLREREILFHVANGRTNAEIAVQLWVSPGTVKKHLEHVYEKLGVSGRTAAATVARAAIAR